MYRIARQLPVISVGATKKNDLFHRDRKRMSDENNHHRESKETIFETNNRNTLPNKQLGKNNGFIDSGIDTDTTKFAVDSIACWWKQFGMKNDDNVKSLYIIVDIRGNNNLQYSYLKQLLQQLANETVLTIQVSHYPPGTSKWNEEEYFLFNHLVSNRQDNAFIDMQTIIKQVGLTNITVNQKIHSFYNDQQYPLQIPYSDTEIQTLLSTTPNFQPDWNYTIKPQK
jgi:hypothetical protein